jgi:hypothetical protein
MANGVWRMADCSCYSLSAIRYLPTGETMDDVRILNRKYETIAWGAFFIWLGVTNLFQWLPSGTGAVGIGLILLGMNLVRYLSKLPTSGVTLFLGALALVLGLLDLTRALLRLEIALPFFPLLVIAIGIVWLVRGLVSTNVKRINE